MLTERVRDAGRLGHGPLVLWRWRWRRSWTSRVLDTGRRIAALARQHQASLEKALEGVQVAETPLERIKRSRVEMKVGCADSC
jgi:hypothetical protein